MNATESFISFDKVIRLTQSKKNKLQISRDNLRVHIKKYFKDHGWGCVKFHSQGSFVLDTNLNTIPGNSDNEREEYDIDDGVYYICKENERPTVATFHARVKEAVSDVTSETIDKNTCVRVVYADGYHVDIPMYWFNSQIDRAVPYLAHKSKGYIESDPRAFGNWVSKKISYSNNNQLKRLIRYFKAWVDYREFCNSQVRLPSGFILTILACNNYVPNDCDDVSFSASAKEIYKALNINYSCYRPTLPTNEELLASKGYQRDKLLNELKTLVDKTESALSETNEKRGLDIWQSIFGERFPCIIGEKTTNIQKSNYSFEPGAPWSIN